MIKSSASGIVVVGAGGHAKVCIELLQASGHDVAYAVGGADSADTCVGVTVVRGDEYLVRLLQNGHSRAFVAVGSNPTRRRLADYVRQLGYKLENAISPDSIISRSVVLGEGVAVMAGAVINACSVIHDYAIINTGAVVDHDCSIGVAAHIAANCALAGNVAVGACAFIGVEQMSYQKSMLRATRSWGRGAWVIRDVAAGDTVVGAPARSI